MTTYKEIFGKSVKSFDTGPSPATTLEGSINYDTPNEQFKSAETREFKKSIPLVT